MDERGRLRSTLRYQFDAARIWLIRRIAGRSPILMNLTVAGGEFDFSGQTVLLHNVVFKVAEPVEIGELPE